MPTLALSPALAQQRCSHRLRAARAARAAAQGATRAGRVTQGQAGSAALGRDAAASSSTRPSELEAVLAVRAAATHPHARQFCPAARRRRLRSLLTLTRRQRVRMLGPAREALVAAYARVLGMEDTLAALRSNLTVRRCAVARKSPALTPWQMLFASTTPEDVDEVFALMTRVLGGADAARALCLRDPSLLYTRPDAIRDSVAALEEVLGGPEARDALARNPTLMQGGRAAHVRQALSALTEVASGDAGLARDMVRRNTLLLGTRTETLLGAADAIEDIFDSRPAAFAVIFRHPGLLRSTPRTLLTAHEELLTVFGSRPAVAELLSRNSSLLKARASTIRLTWQELLRLFGSPAEAGRFATKQLGVLRSKPETVQAAAELLTQLFGRERAKAITEAVPVLLQIRSVVLDHNWKLISSFLGPERAAEVVSAVAVVLCCRLGRLSGLLDTLVTIYGSAEVAAAAAPPVVFRYSDERIGGRFALISDIMGLSNARTAVLADSTLLTCSSIALRARMERQIAPGDVAALAAMDAKLGRESTASALVAREPVEAPTEVREDGVRVRRRRLGAAEA